MKPPTQAPPLMVLVAWFTLPSVAEVMAVVGL
jgi:hypothetical protein